MRDSSSSRSGSHRPEVLVPEVADGSEEASGEAEINETIDHPAKVMRIGTMLKQLLGELRSADLDEPSR